MPRTVRTISFRCLVLAEDARDRVVERRVEAARPPHEADERDDPARGWRRPTPARSAVRRSPPAAGRRSRWRVDQLRLDRPGPSRTSPKTDSTSSRPGSRAISAEYASPPATSPPPAWSYVSRHRGQQPDRRARRQVGPRRDRRARAGGRRRSSASVALMASGAQVLEQPGLHVLGPHAPRGGEQRPDLATADVPSTAELDARQPARPRPRADRLGPEPARWPRRGCRRPRPA